MSLVAPVHIAAVGLANLRFFGPPNGGREFPYVSVDDLHACLSLPHELRRTLKSNLRSTKWRDDTFTVATADGIVSLVPHFMAQGLIHAMQEVGRAPAGFHDAYIVGGSAAMTKITSHLSPDEMVAYTMDAWKNIGGKPA